MKQPSQGRAHLSAVKIKRLTLIAIGTAVLGTAVLLALSPAAPEQSVDDARRALAEVRASDARHLVPTGLAEAEVLWAETLAALREESDRPAILRNYSHVDSLAVRLVESAAVTIQQTATLRDSLRRQLAAERLVVHARANSVSSLMAELPRTETRIRRWAEAELNLHRSDAHAKSRKYATALEHLRQGNRLLVGMETELQTQLTTWMENAPQWDRWVRETLKASRDAGTSAIIVDKLNRTLHLYTAGRRIQSWPVELGPEWVGDKQMEGDNATPEGRYRIIRKRGRGETRYYRALEIDFPNAEDRRAFTTAKREGLIPANARIGGLIEIHGEGGKGADWTNGCVAMTNTTMNELFRQVAVGTPVTIVGTMN
ncbi:MAG: L,D-transpeptidase family protein [Rhodothermales bacterium]